MPRISSGSAVAGLTAMALAAICAFAYQASGSAPQRAPTTERAAASPSARPSQPPSGARKGTHAVPADSGTGKRVVYALGERRVWLVSSSGEAVRTFRVTPSTVDPVPGTYEVKRRNSRITGSDGVPVEHVVVFGSLGSTVIGFSAAVDGSMPTPDPKLKTGGIRQNRPDAAATWRFAMIGVKVVVVS